MNWEAIGAVGEIVGALAVFSSLVYLASQIRVQNRESRVASVHEVTEAYRSTISVLQKPEMADLFVEALENFDDLTPSNRIRFITFMLSLFRVFEDGYYQWQQGRLEDEAWHSMISPMRDLLEADGPSKVWSLRKHQFRPDFVKYLDGLELGKYSI
jgi:hypothetical protein